MARPDDPPHFVPVAVVADLALPAERSPGAGLQAWSLSSRLRGPSIRYI